MYTKNIAEIIRAGYKDYQQFSLAQIKKDLQTSDNTSVDVVGSDIIDYVREKVNTRISSFLSGRTMSYQHKNWLQGVKTSLNEFNFTELLSIEKILNEAESKYRTFIAKFLEQHESKIQYADGLTNIRNNLNQLNYGELSEALMNSIGESIGHFFRALGFNRAVDNILDLNLMRPDEGWEQIEQCYNHRIDSN
jgi:hypothetical protein